MKNTIFFTAILLLLFSSCKTKAVRNISKLDEPSKKAINLCGPTVADLNTEPGYDGTLAPIFPGLDVYHYPITTQSETAQKYFDQGFVLNYGFNHPEAARSFRECIRQDPECAMCYWGLAYVLGPNYNAVMEKDLLTPANEALAKARLYQHRASKKEQRLISALSKRYPKSKEIDPQPFYKNYATAMGQVHHDFPDDIDIAVMYAEALLDLHPWDLWLKNGQAQAWTPEILSLLEAALATTPDHPQALHLYIHAVEASRNPEIAKEAADRLRFRVPGAGHLVHMPSHLYIRTGHYHEGTIANERAVKIDSTYVASCHVAGIYPLAYYPHNWHFLAACAALEGKGKRALEASRYMADFVVDKNYMRMPDLATLQHYYTIPWYIMVKFAMWEAILSEPQPASDLLYPTAIWHYARAMALVANKRIPEAQESLKIIAMIEKDSSIQELTVWEINKIPDLVTIAKKVVGAEIAHHLDQEEKALELYYQAIVLEDQLNYNEPPDWFFSVRHHLGDVLLKTGQFAEAERLYREDLETFKENGWALQGLYRSELGQGKKAEAQRTLARFKQAWQWADIQLTSSIASH